MPDRKVILDAVTLACRAPSLHNSQPWRWKNADGAALHLFADRKRLVPATDRSGREMILSCGAVLDHLRVAIAAAGWDTAVARFPDPTQPDHVAAVEFGPLPIVGDTQRARADAIHRRRTDRLPFAAPRGWDTLESTLRGLVDAAVVMLDVVPDDARPQLADASRLTESLRRQDPTHQSELRWWTSPFELDQGVPPTSRVSASEASRVDVARAFPTDRVRRTPRADRPGSLQDHRAVHSRRHQPRGVAVRRSVIDRVARVHRCRHGDVHAHPSHGDHAEPKGHPPTHPTARSPAALDTSGHHTSRRRTTTSPHTPTTRDRGSAVPQVALALPAAPHQLRVRPQRSVRSTGSQLRHCETS